MPWGNKFPDMKNDPTYLEGRLSNAETSLAENAKYILINVKDYGAVGDGITDDTANVKKAFDFASTIENIPKVIIFPTASYMINGTTADGNESDYGRLRIPSNTIIDLCGSTLTIIPNTNQHSTIFRADTKNNIIVKNGYLYGDLIMPNSKSGEWQFGVAFLSCKNITVDNVKCYNMRGDGIYFAYNDVTVKNENVLINNCFVDTVWRNGISVTSGKNVVIQNTTVQNTTGGSLGCGIDFEPDHDIDSEYIENALVYNCTFNNIVGAAAIRFQYSKNCKAIKNKINNSQWGAEARQSYNIEYDSNEFLNVQGIILNGYPSGYMLFRRNLVAFYQGALTGMNGYHFNIIGTASYVRVSNNEFVSSAAPLLWCNAPLSYFINNDFIKCETTDPSFEYLRTRGTALTYFYQNKIIFSDNHSVFADIRPRDNSVCNIKENITINGRLTLANNESGVYSTDVMNGIPTLGTYKVGHMVKNTSPAASGYVGWVCVTDGTMGTLSGVTGSITSGTATLTVNVVGNLTVGQFITIAGVTGTFRILSISGTTITLNANAGTTVSGAAVGYSNAVFKGYGTIGA